MLLAVVGAPPPPFSQPSMRILKMPLHHVELRRGRPRLEVRVEACPFYPVIVAVENMNSLFMEIRFTNTPVGEGFNWSEALRDRSKRSPSFSSGNPFNQGIGRPRSASISNPEPPKELPKPIESPPTRMIKKPDHLGERMLRGDFMMD